MLEGNPRRVSTRVALRSITTLRRSTAFARRVRKGCQAGALGSKRPTVVKRVNKWIRDVSPTSGKRYRSFGRTNLKVRRSPSIKALLNDLLNDLLAIPLQDLTIKGQNRTLDALSVLEVLAKSQEITEGTTKSATEPKRFAKRAIEAWLELRNICGRWLKETLPG